MQRLNPSDPKRIGSYRIAGVLGRGGMGCVYKAYDSKNDPVAVKLLHSDYASNKEFLARFHREIAAVKRMRTPRIARILDQGRLREGDIPWFAYEYVRGQTLQEHVLENGPLTSAELIELVRYLVALIKEMAAAGVVHRDIKPSNIILGPDGPRLIDFGIAHIAGHPALTKADTVIGSVRYMAPEQIFSKAEPRIATDIFALGSVILFAAYGRPPFQGKNEAQVAQAIRDFHPSLDGLSPSLRALVARCLEKDPRKRATVRELQRLLPKMPSTMGRLLRRRKPGVGSDVKRVKHRRQRGRFSLWTVFWAAALTIVLGGLLGSSMIHAESMPPPRLVPPSEEVPERPEIEVGSARFEAADLSDTSDPVIERVSVQNRRISVTVRLGDVAGSEAMLTKSCLKVGYTADNWVSIPPDRRKDDTPSDVIEFGGAMDVAGRVAFFSVCSPEAPVEDGQQLGRVKVRSAGVMVERVDGRLMPIIQASATRSELTVILPDYHNLPDKQYGAMCLKTKAGPLKPAVMAVQNRDRRYQQLTFSKAKGTLYWSCPKKNGSVRYVGAGVKLPGRSH